MTASVQLQNISGRESQGIDAKINWLAVNRQSWSNSYSDSDSDSDPTEEGYPSIAVFTFIDVMVTQLKLLVYSNFNSHINCSDSLNTLTMKQKWVGYSETSVVFVFFNMVLYLENDAGKWSQRKCMPYFI
jgi:hypothetical protein